MRQDIAFFVGVVEIFGALGLGIFSGSRRSSIARTSIPLPEEMLVLNASSMERSYFFEQRFEAFESPPFFMARDREDSADRCAGSAAS